MFHPFQKFLPKAAAEYNFTQQLQAVKVCQEFRSLSKTMLPPEAQAQIFPRSYDGKTLTVGALNSAAAQAVTMQKHHFLEAINQKYGSKTLKNIKVQISAENEGQLQPLQEQPKT